MLVASQRLLRPGDQTATEKILCALSSATRETDITGWYRDGAVIGVLFTEIALAEKSVVQMLSRKVNDALRAVLGTQVNSVDLSFRVFPDDSEGHEVQNPDQETLTAIYPDHGAQKLKPGVYRCW